MIWIHAGIHKTGSSSIQVALRLIRHRVGHAVWTVGESPPPLTPDWTDWIKQRATQGHVFVSDESLLGDPFTGYADLPQRLQDLRGALPDLEMRLVVGLRRQSTWIQSLYLQSLQQGGTLTPAMFWARVESSPFVLWSNLIAEAELVFGRNAVKVFLHEDQRDAVSDFFDLCGLKAPPSVGRPIRENVSVSASQAPIIRRFNEMSSRKEQEIMRGFLQRIAGPDPNGKFSALPESTASAISDLCRTDWHDLIVALSSTGQLMNSQASSAAWREVENNYPGEDLDSPPVEREILRLLSVAVMNLGQIDSPSVTDRLFWKLRTNPGDIPASIVRALRRPRARY